MKQVQVLFFIWLARKSRFHFLRKDMILCGVTGVGAGAGTTGTAIGAAGTVIGATAAVAAAAAAAVIAAAGGAKTQDCSKRMSP